MEFSGEALLISTIKSGVFRFAKSGIHCGFLLYNRSGLYSLLWRYYIFIFKLKLRFWGNIWTFNKLFYVHDVSWNP